MLNRRDILKTAVGGAATLGAADWVWAAPTREKPPWRVLYSNDLTNTLSCISPWHKARQPFSREMIEATVDEVADTEVDVHMLQPGLCWVPLWKSDVYPIAEHAAWLKERYGLKLDPYSQFVFDGGDVVQVFIDRCRKRGQAPFISFRLNDGHHKEFADAKRGEKISGSSSQGLTRLYVEHPEWRLGADANEWGERVWNWSIPEVRAHKLALLTELCERYDLDGLELDFLRYATFFDLERTTTRERVAIMTDFVGQVRQVLDRTARDGRRRWLCARVPCYVDMLDPLGLDLKKLVAAGLDMVNASSNYYTTQRHDLAAIRRRTEGAGLYFELCHTTWTGAKVADGYDSVEFRRATPEQFYTTAHLAYARGADGISAFNFVYYREHGAAGRGPFCEPPFEVFKHLGDREWLARQPQHWFVAKGWRPHGAKPTPVPRNVAPGKAVSFVLDMAPPEGGWRKDGRLRIEADQSLGDSRWTARLNDIELTPTDDVSEPYPNAYPALLGDPLARRAWTVPPSAMREGTNRLEISLIEGVATTLVFIDLAVTP